MKKYISLLLTALILMTSAFAANVEIKDGAGNQKYMKATGAGSSGDPFIPEHTISGTVAATQSGTWNVTNISGTVSLPTGAATETTLSGVNTKLDTIDDIIKSEDAAHTSTDKGVMPLAVRNDAGTALAGTDGDYIPLSTDNTGALRVTGGGGGTQYTEDAAAASDPVGNALIMVRTDSLSGSTVSADGDNIAARATSKGELYVKHSDAIPVTDNSGSLTVDNGGTFAVQATVAAGATTIGKAEDGASADGDVGVPSLAVRKATPANTSGTDGDYEPLQMSAGRLWTSTTIDAALPAGTNAIGKLSANSGVDIGDVDVTTVGTITPGTAASSLGKAEDAAHASGDTGVSVLSRRIDTLASSGGTSGDYVTPNQSAEGAEYVTATATTNGGATPYTLTSAATTNATNVKSSAGQIYMITATNTNASARYLKIYNKASAPTVGTDTPILKFLIPGNTAGAGTNIPIPDCGIALGTGISFALTTGVADSDTGAVAANEIVINIGYK